jgi:hypothetical protein
MTDGMIKDILVKYIADWMETKLITNVSGVTKAKVVKPYRFQENPLQQNIYCWIATGDPQEPFDKDSRVDSDEADDIGMKLYGAEIGGGHLWWRRGTAHIGCYWIRDRFDQDTAAFYSHQILGRAMHWLERCPVSGQVDEFGETALYIFVYGNTFKEGGGNDQFYWRGDIYWQVLTERPY